MMRVFLKAFLVVGIAAFLILIFFVPSQTREPSGEEKEVTKPPTETEVRTNSGTWIGNIYSLPIGPCTMIVKLDGLYWFTLPDETRHYSEDIGTAKEAASAACDVWYANEMASRLIAQRVNEEWQKSRYHPPDISKPLFTRVGVRSDGSVDSYAPACPTLEALEQINKKGMIIESTPRENPTKYIQVTPEYYGCTAYQDGIAVTLIVETPQSGSTAVEGDLESLIPIKTNIGWLRPDNLKN